MPHSSGGGHHGGGFHGGHGGFHGGSGHYGSGRSTKHYYYHHGHVYHYSGEDYDSFKKDRSRYIVYAIILLIVIVIIACYLFPSMHSGEKLKYTENNQICIEDPQGVLGDTANLEQSLRKFKEKSGIAVVIVAIPDYMSNSSLESRAYSLYKEKCKDETFWLIAYSTEDNPNLYYNNWSFEGMQGDRTDEILTSTLTYSFNASLSQKLDRPYGSPADAFSDAFDELTNNLFQSKKNSDIDSEVILKLIFFVGFFCYLVYKIYQMAGVSEDKFYGSDNRDSCSGTESITPAESDMTIPPLHPANSKYRTCMECGATYLDKGNKGCPYCDKKQ